MRILSTALVVAAVLALGAKLAADEAQAEGGLVESIQDLNLTDEQEAKLAGIMQEFRTKNGAALKELAAVVKEEGEKVSAVLTAQQKATLATLKEERKDSREECLAHRIAHLKELDLTDDELARIGEIRAEFRPESFKVRKQLEGLLSSEQQQTREDGLKAGKKRREILASLKLTDDQQAKVAAVAKELGALVRGEAEKIRDVLAAGASEKLQDLPDERRDRVRDRMAHRIANAKELALTAEQKTKLAEIRKEYRPKVQEAGNKARASVREELDMIVAVIKG
jgi:Spy/CpxP family protein refolding chaperone